MKLILLHIWFSIMSKLDWILETFLESISHSIDYSFNEFV